MRVIPPRPIPFRPGDAGRLAEAIVAAWYPGTAPELFRRKLVEAIRTALLRAYGQGRADAR
jgi:hypothetical protein